MQGKSHSQTYYFLPELHFRIVQNSSQGEVSSLDTITLKLVVPEDLAKDGIKALGYVTTAFDEMVDGLKNKYGMPQEAKGTCPITATQIIKAGNMAQHECTATWRAENQVISLENALFLIPNQKPQLFFWV